METLNKIIEIANKQPRDITPDDKQFIEAQAAERGLPFSPRVRCKNCYVDMALQLYKAIKGDEPKTDDGRKWVLKDGVDVIWRDIRINAATITDEKAEEYVRAGFPTKFFKE